MVIVNPHKTRDSHSCIKCNKFNSRCECLNSDELVKRFKTPLFGRRFQKFCDNSLEKLHFWKTPLPVCSICYIQCQNYKSTQRFNDTFVSKVNKHEDNLIPSDMKRKEREMTRERMYKSDHHKRKQEYCGCGATHYGRVPSQERYNYGEHAMHPKRPDVYCWDRPPPDHCRCKREGFKPAWPFFGKKKFKDRRPHYWPYYDEAEPRCDHNHNHNHRVYDDAMYGRRKPTKQYFCDWSKLAKMCCFACCRGGFDFGCFVRPSVPLSREHDDFEKKAADNVLMLRKKAPLQQLAMQQAHMHQSGLQPCPEMMSPYQHSTAPRCRDGEQRGYDHKMYQWAKEQTSSSNCSCSSERPVNRRETKSSIEYLACRIQSVTNDLEGGGEDCCCCCACNIPQNSNFSQTEERNEKNQWQQTDPLTKGKKKCCKCCKGKCKRCVKYCLAADNSKRRNGDDDGNDNSDRDKTNNEKGTDNRHNYTNCPRRHNCHKIASAFTFQEGSIIQDERGQFRTQTGTTRTWDTYKKRPNTTNRIEEDECEESNNQKKVPSPKTKVYKVSSTQHVPISKDAATATKNISESKVDLPNIGAIKTSPLFLNPIFNSPLSGRKYKLTPHIMSPTLSAKTKKLPSPLSVNESIPELQTNQGNRLLTAVCDSIIGDLKYDRHKKYNHLPSQFLSREEAYDLHSGDSGFDSSNNNKKTFDPKLYTPLQHYPKDVSEYSFKDLGKLLSDLRTSPSSNEDTQEFQMAESKLKHCKLRNELLSKDPTKSILQNENLPNIYDMSLTYDLFSKPPLNMPSDMPNRFHIRKSDGNQKSTASVRSDCSPLRKIEKVTSKTNSEAPSTVSSFNIREYLKKSRMNKPKNVTNSDLIPPNEMSLLLQDPTGLLTDNAINKKNVKEANESDNLTTPPPPFESPLNTQNSRKFVNDFNSFINSQNKLFPLNITTAYPYDELVAATSFGVRRCFEQPLLKTTAPRTEIKSDSAQTQTKDKIEILKPQLSVANFDKSTIMDTCPSIPSLGSIVCENFGVSNTAQFQEQTSRPSSTTNISRTSSIVFSLSSFKQSHSLTEIDDDIRPLPNKDEIEKKTKFKRTVKFKNKKIEKGWGELI